MQAYDSSQTTLEYCKLRYNAMAVTMHAEASVLCKWSIFEFNKHAALYAAGDHKGPRTCVPSAPLACISSQV
jgi:hypothetical protein